MFTDFTDKEVLIIGGGKTARRKAEKLLPYGCRISIVALEVCDQLKNDPNIQYEEKIFEQTDLQGKDIVIAAVNDPILNQKISRLAKEAHLPVNVVDDKEESTFLFPALILDHELSIGISTEGASPTAAVWMKDQIQDMIPENFGLILAFLASVRPIILQTIPEQPLRTEIFHALFKKCMKKERPLTAREAEKVIQKLTCPEK